MPTQKSKNSGKFYPSIAVGDELEVDDVFGYVSDLGQRDQLSDHAGTITWIADSGVKVIKNVTDLCTIEPAIISARATRGSERKKGGTRT